MLFRAFRSLSIYDLQPLPLPDDAAASASGVLCWCRFHRPECRCCCFVPDDTFHAMSSAPLSAATTGCVELSPRLQKCGLPGSRYGNVCSILNSFFVASGQTNPGNERARWGPTYDGSFRC